MPGSVVSSCFLLTALVAFSIASISMHSITGHSNKFLGIGANVSSYPPVASLTPRRASLGTAMSSATVDPELASTAGHLLAAKLFSLASCVMLFYDIMLTMDNEVERVWKQKFTPMTVLWFLNRYLSPLGYIIIIVSFQQPWSKAVCDRYVLFPEALKVVTSTAIGIIFVLRLYAIYSRSLAVAVLGSLLLVTELAVKIWSFTDGTRLDLPPGLIGCILVGRSHIRFAFTWVAELVFDTFVFFATLYRTLRQNQRFKGSSASNLLDLILRDGIVYFGVIFAANLITVLLYILAPPDLKAVNASFSTLITSLMVSRLVLNLRGAAASERGVYVHSDSEIPFDPRNHQTDSDLNKDAVNLRREISSVLV